MKLSVQAQLDAFLNALYRDSHLKSRLIVWTFAGLVLPTAFLMAAGVPEKEACMVMTALMFPLLFLVYGLKSSRTTERAVSGGFLRVGLRQRATPVQDNDLKDDQPVRSESIEASGLRVIISDSLLPAIWLIAAYGFERYVVPEFKGTPSIYWTFDVFRGALAFSILAPWALRLYQHLRISWIQNQIRIKQLEDRFAAQGKSVQGT